MAMRLSDPVPKGNAEQFRRMAVHGSRRRRWEVPLLIAVLVVSVFVAGWICGQASANDIVKPCNHLYPPVATVKMFSGLREVPLHPAGVAYARCAKGNL